MNTEPQFEEVLNSVMPYINRLCAGTTKLIDFDDMQSVLMIQTWESWQAFDPTNGAKFTTFLFPALQNKRNMELRRLKAKRRDRREEVGSLDAPISQEDDDGCTFASMLMDMRKSSAPEERLIASEVVNIVYRVLNEQTSEKARKVLMMLLGGETQATIAWKCNCQQSLVSYYRKKFRILISNALMSEGYDEYVPFKFK